MKRTIIKCICPILFCILYLETSAQKKALDAIHARLKNKEDFKKQVIQAITTRSGGSKFIDLALDASETIDEVDIVVEGILLSNELKPKPIQFENAPSTYGKQLPGWVQNYFDDVVNYVITEKGKDEILPDPPPDASYDYCYPCDEDRKKKYSQDTAEYIRKFFGDHGNMISKAIQVIRYFAISKEKKLPYNAEAAAHMPEKMEKDKDYLRDALMKKIQAAWDLYKNNAVHLSVLNHLVLSIHRQYALLGETVPETFPDLNAVGQQMYNTFTKYYDDAVQRRDYTVMLNINWYIGLLRQTTLLYGELPVPDKLYEFMQANRFEVKIDADAELNAGEGKTMTARITGTNYYRAVPDNDCKLRWYLFDPDLKHMKFNLDKAELNLGASASYIGTKEFQTPPAEILLGFCDKPIRDTFLMQNFLPNGKERWVIGDQTVEGNYVVSIMQSSFLDEKRLHEAAANKAKFEKMQKEMMADYQNAIAGNEHLIGKDPKTMTKEEQEKMQKIVAATNAIQNKLNVSAVANNVLIYGALDNNLKTVFDYEADGRILSPRNTAINYAKFKVQIVHVEE